MGIKEAILFGLLVILIGTGERFLMEMEHSNTIALENQKILIQQLNAMKEHNRLISDDADDDAGTAVGDDED